MCCGSVSMEHFTYIYARFTTITPVIFISMLCYAYVKEEQDQHTIDDSIFQCTLPGPDDLLVNFKFINHV